MSIVTILFILLPGDDRETEPFQLTSQPGEREKSSGTKPAGETAHFILKGAAFLFKRTITRFCRSAIKCGVRDYREDWAQDGRKSPPG